MQFGERLRKLRTSQGLTVRELARRVGVSASYISQLENNESKPSYSTLKKLAEVTGATVSLLTEDGFPEEWMVVRKHGRRKIVTSDPLWNVELLAFTGARSKRMQSCFVTLEPGAEGPNPLFQHEREDFICVIQGSLIIKSGPSEYTLSEGDVVYFNFNRPEWFANPGSDETRFLWVVSPAW